MLMVDTIIMFMVNTMIMLMMDTTMMFISMVVTMVIRKVGVALMQVIPSTNVSSKRKRRRGIINIYNLRHLFGERNNEYRHFATFPWETNS